MRYQEPEEPAIDPVKDDSLWVMHPTEPESNQAIPLPLPPTPPLPTQVAPTEYVQAEVPTPEPKPPVQPVAQPIVESSAVPNFFSQSPIIPAASSAPIDMTPYMAPKPGYGHKKVRGPWRGRVFVATLALVLLTGVGYLSYNLFGPKSTEIDEATKAAASGVYVGDGKDVIQVADAATILTCDAGYTKDGTGTTATCVKTTTATQSAAVMTCPTGSTQSGSGDSVTCSKIVGGTIVAVASAASYSCPAGYDTSGSGSATICTKETTAANVANYSCAPGYTTSGSGSATVCLKSNSITGPVIATCPSGFTRSGSGTTTTCGRSVGAAASTTYNCVDAGYVRSGNGCVRTISATSASVATCPAGYTLSGSSDCIKGVNPTCPSGYTFSGSGTSSKCGKLVDSKIPPVGSGIFGGYYCESTNGEPLETPAGVVKEGKVCTAYATPIAGSCSAGAIRSIGKSSYVTCELIASHNLVYSCPAGYGLSGASCSRTISLTAHTTYSCASGSLSGASCISSASVSLSCAAGFVMAGKGSSTTCAQNTAVGGAPNVSYSCPAGYTASGSGSTLACTEDVKAATDVSRTCQSGYTLDGTQCTKIVGGSTVKTTPSVSYACPTGFVQSGSGSSEICTKQVSVSQPPTTAYSCQDGWLKRTDGTKTDCVLTE